MAAAATPEPARGGGVSARRLAILLVLALAVVGGAFWLSARRTPPRDPALGTSVLAGLAAHLDAVDAVKLIGPGEKTLVTLERRDSHWQVAEAAYPADAARVRRLLLALGDLHVIEAKTADPARHAALGVEDPSDPKAQSVRLELHGLAAPTALIVGRAAGTQGSYVRIPGTSQALEARPAIDLARSPHDWLARGVLDIAAARVAAVEFARADGAPWRAERKSRDAAHFEVPDLPRGRELTSAGAADPAGNAFGNLEFDDVRPAVAPVPGEKRHRTVVRCFDGLVVTLEAPAAGTEHWLVVNARFDPELAARFPAAAGQQAVDAAQVKSEAARLTATTSGFEYRVPAYRFDAIFRRRDEILRH